MMKRQTKKCFEKQLAKCRKSTNKTLFFKQNRNRKIDRKSVRSMDEEVVIGMFKKCKKRIEN